MRYPITITIINQQYSLSKPNAQKCSDLQYYCIIPLVCLVFEMFLYSYIQMSELQSESRRQKTKQEYSRNVKKLKIKLAAVQSEIVSLQRRVDSLSNTSNDKLISMKLAKFCKERRFTPEMLFRFADRSGSKSVSKIHFQETLTQLGLKLSKDEFMRLQYLIDEDLSGEISYSEYVGYLEAFGIRKEFSASDQLARQVLQKLEVGKVLQMAQENKQNNNRRPSKHSNLLNYEQFIKYCHKHFPGLKNKELASIFTRLQKNQLINLQDLIDYLEAQEAERKRLQEKNKKRLKRQDSKIKPIAGGERTLKAIIEALLRCRSKQSTIVFHSLEFVRLQRIVGAKRGQLLRLFQEIDQKRRGSFRGSFTYNELINYFIQKSEKSEDLPYAFQLMGGKLALLKQSPEAVVGQYSVRIPNFLSEDELKKFFQGEFEVAFHEYNIIAPRIPQQFNGRYSVEKVADLLRRDGKRDVAVKPNSFPGRLVFRSARMALRCCLELQQKLAQLKQLRWSDYEFGPTDADEFGAQSINLPMPSDQIDWLPCDQLGMAEFYRDGIDVSYTCSPICPHEVFTKTLFSLATTIPDSMWSGEKVDGGVREIEQGHLKQIFKGMYPLAFHHFGKYGIFVVRLFIKQQWRYVIVDNKVPCAADKTPFFSSVTGHRFSFMAIIEKAYAKALGSYQAVYASANPHQYLIDLANLLPVQYALQKIMPETYKDLIWESMVKFQKDEMKAVREGKAKKAKSMFAVVRTRGEEGKEISLHNPLKIEQVVEVTDSKCKNSHKSHRLIIVRTGVPLREEASWNKNWNRDEGGNKYGQLSLQVAQKMVQPSLLKGKSILLINYKLFRSMFALYRPEEVNFAEMIILRKELQFEEKFKCRYQIAAISQLQFVVVLAQRSAAQDVRIVFEAKSGKEEALWKESRREEVAVRTIRIEKGGSLILQLWVQNWKSSVDYRYNLTFYMRHPRYQLKQRDRHMLFRYISPYEEQPKMAFSDYEGAERQFILRNFYRAAERRGCCG